MGLPWWCTTGTHDQLANAVGIVSESILKKDLEKVLLTIILIYFIATEISKNATRRSSDCGPLSLNKLIAYYDANKAQILEKLMV